MSVEICHSACSRTRFQIPARKGRVQPSRTRWRGAARGASGPAAGAADSPLHPSCRCPSPASVRPRSTERAATGSLGTGIGAGCSWTGMLGAESGAC